MRLAQLVLIAEDTYAHPYHCSAFVMSGDGGSVGDLIDPNGDIVSVSVTDKPTNDQRAATPQDATPQLADTSTTLRLLQRPDAVARMLVFLLTDLIFGD